jgi:hypothetical protein
MATLLQSPLNKDYDIREDQVGGGTTGSITPAVQAALDKKPRLYHKRGRFRLPKSHQKLIEIRHELLGEFFEETYREEYLNQYYETVEVTEDTIRNPRYKPKKAPKGKIVDSGGDFTHYKIEYTNVVTRNIHFILDSETLRINRAGHLWLSPPIDFESEGIKVAVSIEPPEEDLDLSGIGPRLWGILNPTKAGVDLGVNIAEIRDFPRLVKGKLDSLKSFVSSLSNPKGLADWILAINFGWKPLLADIRKCIKLYFKMEARIKFLMQNGGKPLYRRTPKWEPIVTDEVLFEYSGPDNQGWMRDEVPLDGDPDGMTDRFKCKLVLHKEVTEAASGVFTYHLGDIPPTPEYLRLKLLGLIVDESLLWEAVRWSWLVDWFSNLGDVISNVEANLKDRVVSLYAYSQRRVVREYKFTCSNGFYDVSVTRVFDTKCRRKIDPFGLAVEVGLSDLQLAILVALGITRS